MKEKLTELLKQADEHSANKCITDYNEAVADNAEYLLANKVVVLLCNIGAKVYTPDQFGRIEAEIERIEITQDGISYEWVKYDRGVDETEVWDDGSFGIADVGKTVFLTFEEYEKAMKERKS